MKQYNYKCVVTKNGGKMYYKRVSNKWKRITNAAGMKAEKGKRKYGMHVSKEVATSVAKKEAVERASRKFQKVMEELRKRKEESRERARRRTSLEEREKKTPSDALFPMD